MVRSAENFSKISNQEDDGSSQPMSMVSVKTTQSKERKKNYLYRKSCTKPPRNCPWWMITTMKTPKQSSSWVLPSPFVFFCSPSSAIGPFSVEGFPSKKQQQQQQPNIAGYWKTLPHLLLFQIGQMWLMEFWAQTW